MHQTNDKNLCLKKEKRKKINLFQYYIFITTDVSEFKMQAHLTITKSHLNQNVNDMSIKTKTRTTDPPAPPKKKLSKRKKTKQNKKKS